MTAARRRHRPATRPSAPTGRTRWRTRSGQSLATGDTAMRSANSRSGLSSMPAARWNREPAPGSEPVDSDELPPGLSRFSTMAAERPASCAAMAPARPQAPAPMTSKSTSAAMTSATMPALLVLEIHPACPQSSNALNGAAHFHDHVDHSKKTINDCMRELARLSRQEPQKCNLTPSSQKLSIGTNQPLNRRLDGSPLFLAWSASSFIAKPNCLGIF